MGQKGNLITIRKIESTMAIVEENSKSAINILEFLKMFNLFLQHRRIWVFKTVLNSVTNTCSISFDLFYLTFNCLNYKKKMKAPNVFEDDENKKNIRKDKIEVNEKITRLFSFFFKNYKKNFYNFSFLVLNTKVDQQILSDVYFKTRAFLKTLFERRFNLYLDFVKVFVLLCQGFVHVSAFLFVLSHILRFLTKRSHAKFLELLKILFNNIIIISNSKIKGLKFTINGKLKGQARASSFSFLVGKVARQTINQTVEFGLVHTNTRIGAFGMRIWLNKE